MLTCLSEVTVIIIHAVFENLLLFRNNRQILRIGDFKRNQLSVLVLCFPRKREALDSSPGTFTRTRVLVGFVKSYYVKSDAEA